MINVLVLKQRKAAAIAAAKEINDIASAADRDLSADESAQYAAHMADAASMQSRIERAQEMAAADVNGSVEIAANARITVEENAAKDPTHGFVSAGEFARTVRAAATIQRNGGGAIDRRLLIGAAAPGTFGGENVGADGGFLIPPQFGKDIFTLSLGEQSLLPYTDNIEIDGNGLAIPKDETTPWGTNGIRAYWQGEGSAATATKPLVGMAQLRLKKLMALVPVSDEMLADSSALATYLPKKIASSIQWRMNEAILFGTGGNLPLGSLNSGAIVTIAKDTGQATKTLTPTNLANMIARLPEGSFPNAVWIINNDVLPSLFTLTLGNYPIYLPGAATVGGLQVNPYGTLLGRPIIVSQHANTFSSLGDVILVDLSYYQTITKAGGMQTASSMHLYFDADVTAFRTTFRMDGESKLAAPIAPAKGTNQLSPFVQLAAR